MFFFCFELSPEVCIFVSRSNYMNSRRFGRIFLQDSLLNEHHGSAAQQRNTAIQQHLKWMSFSLKNYIQLFVWLFTYLFILYLFIYLVWIWFCIYGCTQLRNRRKLLFWDWLTTCDHDVWLKISIIALNNAHLNREHYSLGNILFKAMSFFPLRIKVIHFNVFIYGFISLKYPCHW